MCWGKAEERFTWIGRTAEDRTRDEVEPSEAPPEPEEELEVTHEREEIFERV